MKKKNMILLVLGFIFTFIMLGGFIGVSLMGTYNKEDDKTESVKKIKSSRTLSMMLETGAGTGVYETTTRSTWPTEGYVFNTELSKCENGGKLSWNDENNTVVMTGSTSDKCYVYFDVYNLAVINSLSEEVTTSSIKLTINATAGTKSITKYYYSKDNGTSYTESSSNTYTFSGLTTNTTYNIKVYALDENEKSSAVYSKSVKTDNIQMLADYVKSLYTTQGSNGLYLHNSSLANSAGDNSYRYAGANPNNYVCFGSDATTCPNDNLYRIIGVFGSQVKLIKYDYATSAQLGTNGDYYGIYSHGSDYYKGSNYSNIKAYYWNKVNYDIAHSETGYWNLWSYSQLNTINLNTRFITYLNNQNSRWINMVTTTTWKVGGNSWANIGTSPMYQTYQNEIVSPAKTTTYSAKIGLMYVSDYGYAASPTYWTYKGSDTATTDYRAAVNNNWMYMGLNEWTITRDSFIQVSVSFVDPFGKISGCAVSENFYYAIRPTFYLNSNVTYISGDGTKTLPIRVN